MIIYKKAQIQKITGGKKFKIIADRKTGKVRIEWADGQFGPNGAPCTGMLLEMLKNLKGSSITTGNEGHADKDTTGQPQDVQIDPNVNQQMFEQQQGY